MHAELRYLHSPDADPLPMFKPVGEFGILVQAIVGPDDGPGEESFDFVLCTPGWFASTMKENLVSGGHHLFTKEFEYAMLEKYVRTFCERCSGNSWKEVASKLTSLGHWEFDDYRP